MSTGPQACAKILPVTDVERRPRVTFIGPSETWRARKQIFRRLYELPSVSIFSWLPVLKETHSFFRKEGIGIDTLEIRAEELTILEENIENNVVVSDAADSHAVDDAVTSERYGPDANCATRNFTDTVIQQYAVQQPPTTRVPFTIINVMMDAVGIKDDIAVVRRSADPIVEWDENGTMVAGAFPTLFMMGGEMLPSGSFPSDLTRHLMSYYDGRFERSVTFIGTLFNQLQRHSAVRKAARAATTHVKTLRKLGDLANSLEFKQSLVAAKNDPDSPAAKRLNAGLLRILSIVGGTVPFSPFERAATRPKLSAMRIRFGLPQFWVTVAPPEQDVMTLLRIALLRKLKGWNNETATLDRRSFNGQIFLNTLEVTHVLDFLSRTPVQR
ncbi:hypothetical protein L916_20880 [Phytophthora nicotianae]|uniref:Helitron helicase-like domain-containing protein n=1 Tax=Phytophthora nicotianae TaxID=4792 RepID=W2HTH3_PHYNI|nr:hypothetical protein L916_20880 [Phytophthora nicotianae]